MVPHKLLHQDSAWLVYLISLVPEKEATSLKTGDSTILAKASLGYHFAPRLGSQLFVLSLAWLTGISRPSH
jgi:hypothetical protein